ncbi:biorientation of chromosomes in cell division protein 1-like 1 [Pelodytes ibericus]
MANLPPGDPKLVSQIVNHLKSQGLFDQFRRDCLADVDTKPAYQNLRQRVDNFVSNHLASHTWSPHLNKNQLRNNIRQQVLKSGMLESGIDRIISQVVDPKINHTFRPQVEKVVQEFLATLNSKEDVNTVSNQSEEQSETSIAVTGSAPMVGPSTSVASDAMSILETISSLNQEATAARALTETTNHKNLEKGARKLFTQHSVDASLEKDRSLEDAHDAEIPIAEVSAEITEAPIKQEDVNEMPLPAEEIKSSVSEAISSVESKEIPNESEEQKLKVADKSDKKMETIEKVERKEEKKESRSEKINEYPKRNDDAVRQKEDKPAKERDQEPELVKHTAPDKSSSDQKAADISQEECESVDSDIDAYTDVTVSSVHTSDLSSFDEESNEEAALSDSTEEGEITTDDEDKVDAQSEAKSVSDLSDAKPKSTRRSYVHKPYLYSKYYSDSDDELTVEQRRQSVAKAKEERLLRRQVKRERLEEKRKLRAAERKKTLKTKSQDIECQSSKGFIPKTASIKEVLKEQLFLEKKVAMSKKKKKALRVDKNALKLKADDEDSKDSQKNSESSDKYVTSTKEVNAVTLRSDPSKPSRKLVESGEDSRSEREHKKKAPLPSERSQQDSETRDSRKLSERHDSTSEDQQKQKNGTKLDKHLKKEGSEAEMQSTSTKNIQKKESKLHRNEHERTFPEDRSSKHKYKTDGVQKSDDYDQHRSKRNSKDDESSKRSQSKSSSEERSDRKFKHKSEGKSSTHSKEEKTPKDHKTDESTHKDSKHERYPSTDKLRSEHRYKRSLSDSRPRRDSQSSSKQQSVSQKKSKTPSEDKNEADSANSDNNSKQEDGMRKDKRRVQSSDERASSKATFKSSSKSLKLSDQEETTQKTDKDKNIVGSSVDKPRRSKSNDKDSEERTDSATAQMPSNLSKESNHRSKHSGDKGKERSRNESRERSSSKFEKKYSGENSKSSSSKHSHKDVRRKEDFNKSEEKPEKYMDEKRSGERGSSLDRKSNKKAAEQKGETSKTALSRKTSKLESENEGTSCAGEQVKVSAISGGATEARQELISFNAGQPAENEKSKKAIVSEIKEAIESIITDPSYFQEENPNSETSKGLPLKCKSKQGSSEPKPNRVSGACRHVSSIIPTLDFHETKDLITLTLPSVTDSGSRIPRSDVVSSDSVENSRTSTRKRRSADNHRSGADVSQTSGETEKNPSQNVHAVACSRLSPVAVLSEITGSNDSEISTSDLTNQNGKRNEEPAVLTNSSSSNSMVPMEISELDNTVTGNDVEEGSAMDADLDVTQSISNNTETDSDAEGKRQLTERNVESSVLETNAGETSATSLLHSAVMDGNFAYLSNAENVRHEGCGNAATSSSTGENAATSSNTPMDRSRKESTSNEGVMTSFDNSREYMASTSADVENFPQDSDATMLSDNSFEDATTSSSSYKPSCTEENFSDVPLSSEKCQENTASSSQSASNALPEHEAPVGNVTLNAATSSIANKLLSENSQENAATSSDNANANTTALGIVENVIMRAATSSDNTAETRSVLNFSGNGVTHAATSSDSVVESDGVQCNSENLIAHPASSSDSSTESDDGAPGESENIITHAATSSSNVVNSSRGVNAEGSVASSEVDNGNATASSSYVMDSCTSNSSAWLKNPPERDENAASSSSTLPRNDHKNLSFTSVEDSKNASATSSTQHDGVFDDRCMEVMSSGALKEYPVNSSDIAMDSSTEASVSVMRDVCSGSAGSCSSSGSAQSRDNQEADQEKAKDNTASSSSTLGVATHDIRADHVIPSQNGGVEASSSSSSYMDSRTLHTIGHVPRITENTEATASSSIVMNSRTEHTEVILLPCPGNSSDNAATSSSNSTGLGSNRVTDVRNINLSNNIQATTSSSVAMDSSTGEDMDIGFVVDTENRSNTATSSSTLNNVGKEAKVEICEKDLGMSASSSTVARASTKENTGTVVCTEKINENAATSSDMMDSSTENMSNSIAPSNNTVCATTSSSNTPEVGADQEMDGSFSINSEATAASSSNATENNGENATSSNYVMDGRVERENVSHTVGLDKNEEAASSSGLFSGERLQEVREEESSQSQTGEDATSSERPNNLNAGFRIGDEFESENNENNAIVEAGAESSFAASRSSASISGTYEEAVLLLAPSNNNDGELVLNSDDAANNAICERSDEKEDAVSSASSEEQRVCSNNSRQDIRVGDGETDGAVTSVGTEVSDSSVLSENCEACGHVTFVHLLDVDVGKMAASCPAEEVAVSHTSGEDLNERVSDANVDNRVVDDSESNPATENRHYDTVAGAGTDHEPERSVSKVTLEEGEGAVTSTGITEENYGEKPRRGIRESDSSCSGTEVDRANVTNRQETRDLNAITEDDESAITSTGAKEDEEEGEGFVTSTGTASEDSSFSTGIEENSNSAVVQTDEKGNESIDVYNETGNKETASGQTGPEGTTESVSFPSAEEHQQDSVDSESTEEMDNQPRAAEESTSVISDTISDKCKISISQVSDMDINASGPAASILKYESGNQLTNTSTTEELSAGHQQMATTMTSSSESSVPSEHIALSVALCSEDNLVKPEDGDVKSQAFSNNVVDPTEMEGIVMDTSCPYFDNEESHSLSGLQNPLTVTEPSSGQSDHNPEESESHYSHGDIRTEPDDKPTSEHSDEDGIVPTPAITTEERSGETSNVKTEDTEKSCKLSEDEETDKAESFAEGEIEDNPSETNVQEESNNECITITTDLVANAEDLSTAAEESISESSVMEPRQEGSSNECITITTDLVANAASECNAVEDLSTAAEESISESSVMEPRQGQSSALANEDTSPQHDKSDPSSHMNESKEEPEATEPRDSSNEVAMDDSGSLNSAKEEANEQNLLVLPKDESTPPKETEINESGVQETTKQDCTEEECTAEKAESGPVPLKELSKQDTEQHSSTGPVQTKRGRKPLIKVKEDTDKVSEKAKNQCAMTAEEETKPKVEPDKRKRGRPPKKRKLSESQSTDSPVKNKPVARDSSSDEKHKSPGNTNVNKVPTDLEEEAKRLGKCDLNINEKTTAEPARRRGRKPKQSLSSSETESSEPEKKLKKSQSEEEEGEDQKQSEEEEEEDDEEDAQKGATTRAASRLEAQMKLPHKPTTRATSKLGSPEPSKERRRKPKTSPESNRTTNVKSKTPQAHGSAKRKRETSPPVVHTRGHRMSEDVPAKRTKRQ